MHRLACIAIVVALAACGGKSGSSSTSPANTGGGGAAGTRLPWEAALTVGAAFTLGVDMEDGEGATVVVKVTAVDDTGSERVYSLDWGEEGNGPSKIIVRGELVLLNDAKPEDMQEPSDTPAGTCYGEDFSNPDGCEDICDGQLCLNESGIVSVFGLYAPNYEPYSAK